MNAGALRVRFSKSLANRRHRLDRLSQAKVRSTTQRLGRTSKPGAVSERLTISPANSGNSLAKPCGISAPGNRPQRIAFSKTGIHQDMPFLPITLLAGIVSGGIDVRVTFFSAFNTLAVDDAGGWAGLPIT
jgi:hypothetical protein